jgi:DNA polymerase (family X)
MTNAEVARILDEIADLLEISDENPFKVRSYRRAAETVAALPREIADIHATDGLDSLPGFGKALAEKVGELLDTGAMAYREELAAQFPDGILELLRIPGFGPKRLAQVYRSLGIATVDDLEQAALDQRLRELPGMGAKSEEKLLHNIGLYRQGSERALLGDILPVAEGFVETLRAIPGVLQAEMAGSARRRRETVGDLDLLATSIAPETVCRAFADSGALTEVTLAGDTKVSGLLPGGRQVDLRVVPPDSYGAALVYFTGSQAHCIAIRERALKRDLTINEYGVFHFEDEQKGEHVAGATEEEVYAAIGLPFIPPELREDRGELAAADAGKLPGLVELADIRGDLHMHTVASDGHNELRDMAGACRARGYEYCLITDHSGSLYVANGLDADRLAAQRAAIDALNAEYESAGIAFRVLAGSEADIMPDGHVDLPPGAREHLDCVLGSIHQGFSADADRITTRMVTAIESGDVDIIAHPTGRLLLQRDPYGLHIEKVIDAAAAHGVALEINAFPNRLDLSDIHARLARERGVRLSLGTDAHDKSHLDFMKYGVMTARRAWLEPGGIINTMPLADLRRWLKARRR